MDILRYSYNEIGNRTGEVRFERLEIHPKIVRMLEGRVMPSTTFLRASVHPKIVQLLRCRLQHVSRLPVNKNFYDTSGTF